MNYQQNTLLNKTNQKRNTNHPTAGLSVQIGQDNLYNFTSSGNSTPNLNIFPQSAPTTHSFTNTINSHTPSRPDLLNHLDAHDLVNTPNITDAFLLTNNLSPTTTTLSKLKRQHLRTSGRFNDSTGSCGTPLVYGTSSSLYNNIYSMSSLNSRAGTDSLPPTHRLVSSPNESNPDSVSSPYNTNELESNAFFNSSLGNLPNPGFNKFQYPINSLLAVMSMGVNPNVSSNPGAFNSTTQSLNPSMPILSFNTFQRPTDISTPPIVPAIPDSNSTYISPGTAAKLNVNFNHAHNGNTNNALNHSSTKYSQPNIPSKGMKNPINTTHHLSQTQGFYTQHAQELAPNPNLNHNSKSHTHDISSAGLGLHKQGLNTITYPMNSIHPPSTQQVTNSTGMQDIDTTTTVNSVHYAHLSNDEVIERIRDILTRDKLRQKELAQELGFSGSTLSPMLKNKYRHTKSSHINLLRIWSYEKDKQFVKNIITQTKYLNLSTADIATHLGLSEQMIKDWIDMKGRARDRQKIDTLLTNLTQKLGNKRILGDVDFLPADDDDDDDENSKGNDEDPDSQDDENEEGSLNGSGLEDEDSRTTNTTPTNLRMNPVSMNITQEGEDNRYTDSTGKDGASLDIEDSDLNDSREKRLARRLQRIQEKPLKPTKRTHDETIGQDSLALSRENSKEHVKSSTLSSSAESIRIKYPITWNVVKNAFPSLSEMLVPMVTSSLGKLKIPGSEDKHRDVKKKKTTKLNSVTNTGQTTQTVLSHTNSSNSLEQPTTSTKTNNASSSEVVV